MSRTLLVGILNVTPDSFSDGNRFTTVDAAVTAALSMVEAGAHWIDVGGESTRPWAVPVPADEEQARIVPVITALSAALAGRALIAVDTYKSTTAEAAIAAGARVVNDISGGCLDPRLLDVAARGGAAVVLGHLRGDPATMMDEVNFGDVVDEVSVELTDRVRQARAAGCREIWVDPGIGFGKRLPQNLALLHGMSDLVARVAVPVMVGVSRKKFLGDLTGRATGEREFGTAAAVAAAVLGGASAIRVHDVGPMRDVILVAEAIRAGAPTVADRA